MIVYYKLFNLLNKKGMKKTQLLKIISSPTLAKLNKGEIVKIDIIDKICIFLHCQPGDIMECIIREEIDSGYIMETVPMLGEEDHVSFFKDEENHSFEDRMAVEYIKKQKASKENSD